MSSCASLRFPPALDGGSFSAADSCPDTMRRVTLSKVVSQQHKDCFLPLVAVLFARSDSVYKRLPGCDVWDIERDARSYAADLPVIAHPPCRAWAGLRHMAKPRPDEKELALFAVDQVRRCGGVLEHPRGSTLWEVAGLPLPGKRDEFGGFTFSVCQSDFGHRAKKPTWLYCCGIDAVDLPVPSLRLGEAPCIIGTSGRRLDGSRSSRRPEVSKIEREATPPEFAAFLFDLAFSCKKSLFFHALKQCEKSGFRSCSVSTTATNSHN